MNEKILKENFKSNNIANICIAVEILAGCATIGTVCVVRKTLKPLWGLVLIPFGRVIYRKEKKEDESEESK